MQEDGRSSLSQRPVLFDDADTPVPAPVIWRDGEQPEAIKGPLIIEALDTILSDSRHAAVQKQALGRVCQRYVGKEPDRESAELIARVARGESVDAM